MKDRDTIIEPVIDDIDIEPDEPIDDDDIVIDPDEPIVEMYGCPWPDEPIDPDEPFEVMYGCDWPDDPNIYGELVDIVIEPDEPIIDEEVIEIIEDPMFKARSLDKEEF